MIKASKTILKAQQFILIKTLMRLVQTLFMPMAIIFLGFVLINSWSDVSTLFKEANLLLVLPIAILWALTNLLSPLMVFFVLRHSDNALTYKDLLFIHFYRLPARFIPGGIWQTVSRVADMNKRGIKAHLLAELLFVENTLPLGITLGIGGGILSSFQTDGFYILLTISAMVVGIIIFCSTPLVISKATKARKKTLSYDNLFIYLIVSFFWLIATSCFLLYITSFGHIHQAINLFELAGIYLISWAIGFVSFFAPQGIGVFETVASKMMSGSAPELALFQIIALMAGFRLIIILADVLAYSSWVVFRLFRRIYS